VCRQLLQQCREFCQSGQLSQQGRDFWFGRRVSVSWRFDDEPGYKIEIGGFACLLFLVGNDEITTGLQSGSDTLLECPGDGIRKDASFVVVAYA